MYRTSGTRGRAAFLIATACLLSACGPRIVYDYQPPETEVGRLCTAQCSNTKTLCTQSEEHRYQQCQSNYQLMLSNYNACVAAEGKGCISPTLCSPSSTYQCNQGFRECYKACGGQVTAREVE